MKGTKLIKYFLGCSICMMIMAVPIGCTKRKSEYMPDQSFIYNSIQESKSKKDEINDNKTDTDAVKSGAVDNSQVSQNDKTEQGQEESTEMVKEDGSISTVSVPHVDMPYIPLESLDTQNTSETTEQEKKDDGKTNKSDSEKNAEESEKKKTKNKKQKSDENKSKKSKKTGKSTPTDAETGNNDKDTDSENGDIDEKSTESTESADSEEDKQPETDNKKADEVVRIWYEGTLGNYIWGETPDTSSIKVYAEFGDGSKKEIEDYTIDMNYPERHAATFNYPATYRYGVYNATISYEGVQTECAYNLMILYVKVGVIQFFTCKDPETHHATKKKLDDVSELYGIDVEVYVCHECEDIRWYDNYDAYGNKYESACPVGLYLDLYVPVYYDYTYTLDDLYSDDYNVNRILDLSKYTIKFSDVTIHKDSVVSQGYVARVYSNDIYLLHVNADNEQFDFDMDGLFDVIHLDVPPEE